MEVNSAHPVTLKAAPHLMIQMGISSWPSLSHVPVVKLPVDKESEYQAILASAVEVGVLLFPQQSHREGFLIHDVGFLCQEVKTLQKFAVIM